MSGREQSLSYRRLLSSPCVLRVLPDSKSRGAIARRRRHCGHSTCRAHLQACVILPLPSLLTLPVFAVILMLVFDWINSTYEDECMPDARWRSSCLIVAVGSQRHWADETCGRSGTSRYTALLVIPLVIPDLDANSPVKPRNGPVGPTSHRCSVLR